MRYSCCDPRRLEVLRRSGSANAIEYLEVLDKGAPPGVPRQRTLFVRLLRPGFVPTPDQLRIEGGERIPTVGIVWVAPADALPPEAEPGLADGIDDPGRTLVIRTVGAGDFSTYTLRIVANAGTDDPPSGFDPRLAAIAFSFKVECPTDFDCAQPPVCPDAIPDRPAIDYLAKDYQGFRRLMLDRLSLLVPGWTERSPADLGVTLVELLAYAADNLSYRQDAVANEAYLGTARQRVSVRRHARLVDYAMHEGCNARAFVHLAVAGDGLTLPAGTEFLTRTAKLDIAATPGSAAWREAIAAGALVFESAAATPLDERLNELAFYTWGDGACCLPRGATAATLAGDLGALLRVGDLLLFEEVVSPTSFVAGDADRTHRWAVRLTSVAASVDPSGGLFLPEPVDGPVPVTEIGWDGADALPFPLCLSVAARPGLAVSVARGNVVLVDHGRTVTGEALGTMPESSLALVPAAATGCCDRPEPTSVPPRFRPALVQGPLAHGFDLAALLAVPIAEDRPWWPASALGRIDPRGATPRIADLAGTLGSVTEHWRPLRDLLSSDAAATEFVVEIEDSGRARLRFGDDDHGKRPDPGTAFTATYRIGNGTAGNVGAEAIAHVATPLAGAIFAVRNPLPATGGVEPEDIEQVRRDAPEAFRTQERAVTATDYAAAAERRPDVQRAAATFRWTGSWHTVFVTPDRFGGGAVDDVYAARLRRHLERFRMTGYDLEIRNPRYVPLDIRLHICVAPDHFRAPVRQAVEQALSAGVLRDGTPALFNPDRFTFGQPVYLSQLVATAQAVQGVEAVQVDRFQRLVEPSPTSLDEGVIAIGGLEIAQLANNPNFRERGRLTVTAGGGK